MERITKKWEKKKESINIRIDKSNLPQTNPRGTLPGIADAATWDQSLGSIPYWLYTT